MAVIRLLLYFPLMSKSLVCIKRPQKKESSTKMKCLRQVKPRPTTKTHLNVLLSNGTHSINSLMLKLLGKNTGRRRKGQSGAGISVVSNITFLVAVRPVKAAVVVVVGV